MYALIWCTGTDDAQLGVQTLAKHLPHVPAHTLLGLRTNVLRAPCGRRMPTLGKSDIRRPQKSVLHLHCRMLKH